MKRKRHALFVGVNDYADEAFRNLRYSLSDAVALSGAFAARGFEVEVLSNPKADAVLGAVERKASGLGPGDVFLFFFADMDRTVSLSIPSRFGRSFT